MALRRPLFFTFVDFCDNRHSLTVVREPREFSRHPYTGRIARSSLRQHSLLVICAVGYSRNVVMVAQISTVIPFDELTLMVAQADNITVLYCLS